MPQENKTAVSAKTGSQQPVTFRDRAFKSRTIVFVDGSTVPVISGLITVSTSERIEHLTQLDEFERTNTGA